jgi:hypothetical protein
MFYVFMLSETANRGHYWSYIWQVSSNGKLGYIHKIFFVTYELA